MGSLCALLSLHREDIGRLSNPIKLTFGREAIGGLLPGIKAPHVTNRVRLQHKELPGRHFTDDIEPEQRDLRKRRVCPFAKPNDVLFVIEFYLRVQAICND